MAVECKCSQCGKIARCRMRVEQVGAERIITYLCSACQRELGDKQE